jgi:DNA-binding transcriptional LysR family regulator
MASMRTLKVFLAVVRLGSFAAAGQAVGLTAAAIGQQMRSLEGELNQPLFSRSGRAVVLSPSGRRLVPEIEQLVARWELLASGAEGDELSGTVVMGALVSALMGAFADALWVLRQDSPRLEVKLFAGLSADFAERVQRGELDAAIVTQSPRPLPASLVWTPLYSEPMVLIAPTQSKMAMPGEPLEMLRRCPFIRFDRETWTGHLVASALRQARVQVQEGMELNSVEAIVAIVQQGFGVSIVPRLANVDWTADRRLRVLELPGVTVARRVGLLERRQHGRMRVTQAIKTYFRQRPAARGRGRRPPADTAT